MTMSGFVLCMISCNSSFLLQIDWKLMFSILIGLLSVFLGEWGFCLVFIFWHFEWLSCALGDEVAVQLVNLGYLEWSFVLDLRICLRFQRYMLSRIMVVEKLGMPHCRQTHDRLLASMTLYMCGLILWHWMWNHVSQLSQQTAFCFHVTALLHVPHGHFGALGPGLVLT